jgi:2-alkenal reductase
MTIDIPTHELFDANQTQEQQHPMLEPKPRTNNSILWIVGGVLTLLLVGCVLTAAVGMLLITPFRAQRTTLRPAPAESASVRRLAQVTPQALVVVATPDGGLDYESAVLMNIYEQVNPSVVNITNFALGGSLDRLPGNFHQDDLLPVSGGSGFVWDMEGHVVTNHHVVQGADQLQVTFSDGRMAMADVVGADPSSDLAVLQIDPEGYNLTPVRRG